MTPACEQLDAQRVFLDLAHVTRQRVLDQALQQTTELRRAHEGRIPENPRHLSAHVFRIWAIGLIGGAALAIFHPRPTPQRTRRAPAYPTS
jgi:hypothetical protein